MDMTIIILISCAIVISILVFSYERKIGRITKHNQSLAIYNIKLIDATESLMRAGNELEISCDALYEVAKERFEDEEIKELFNEKFKLVVENAQKGEIRMMMEDKFMPKTEDEVIKEVAEEEGLTEEEVREMWELFKKEAREYQEYKRMKSANATKLKRDKKKIKLKRKNVKKSRKQNRK